MSTDSNLLVKYSLTLLVTMFYKIIGTNKLIQP